MATKGVLLHRGYSIEDLAEQSPNILEVCYLLLYGELPNAKELEPTFENARDQCTPCCMSR